MTIFSKAKQAILYLWGKKDEVSALNEKDILLSKVVMDIHRTRTHSQMITIDLFGVYPVHPINRPNALNDTKKRVAILENVQQELRKNQHLSQNILQKHIPSISGIKVVKQKDQTAISFEGNGRLAALQTVFSATDQLTLEVEEYVFTDPVAILKQMDRLRDLHNLR